MTQATDNLCKILNTLPNVSSAYEYYNYIKIETNCSMELCHEFLSLYAKINNNKILITDLNGILEAYDSSNLSNEKIIKIADQNNLLFDGRSFYAIININDIFDTINNFFNLIKLLSL